MSSESGHLVEWTTEENYMFRLSKFGSDLLDWINKGGETSLVIKCLPKYLCLANM